MSKSEVLAWLKAEQDPVGIANWKKHEAESGGLRSYGIGLTRLRKYARQRGRDHRLARQLWQTRVYDAKVLSLLIDDPKQMTIEQAEQQVEELAGGHLAHVFSACDATLAKTPFVRELLDTWIRSKDVTRRCCGYGLLYEVAKWKKKSAPSEQEFAAYVARIEKAHPRQPMRVRMAMAGALQGIGARSKKLHRAALRVGKQIGPLQFDPTGRCDPYDVAKNLSHPVIKKRLGL